MCGIAGFLDHRGSADERRGALQAMCDQIVHRGPDDQGYFVGSRVGLGMRRLSIIDLTGGHQPIASPDGARQIVFNGEIFNYRQLRERLIVDGHRFETASDTEVILRQYEVNGVDCVQKLNGMFGFAIWDDQAQRLLLARDRMGVKPLYYAWVDGTLYFGSEIKSLLAAGVPAELDEEAIWHYLTFRYVPQPLSVWKYVRKLLPGHRLIVEGRAEPRVERWWACPAEDSVPPRADSDYVREFTDLFESAVQLRLVADVPVGVLLSGGLDSSAVLTAAARAHGRRMETFSVGYSAATWADEREYARLMARHVGADHHEVAIGQQDLIDTLPRFVELTDEPLSDIASIPLFHVSRLARSRVKVVLSGEGSDEILGGYDLERAVRRWQVLDAYRRVPSRLRAAAASTVRRGPYGIARLLDEGAHTAREELERTPPTMTNLMSSTEKIALLRPSFAASRRDSLEIARAEVRASASRTSLGRLLSAYRQSWLVEDLLMKADRMTMGNSIELRVPFLDYRLVEWAARAPDSVKVRRRGLRWTNKWVLREYCRSRVPKSIVERPKRGFSVPFYDWLASGLRTFARDVLTDAGAITRRWLEPAEVEAWVRRGTAEDASAHDRRVVWNLIILELWGKRWINT